MKRIILSYVLYVLACAIGVVPLVIFLGTNSLSYAFLIIVTFALFFIIFDRNEGLKMSAKLKEIGIPSVKCIEYLEEKKDKCFFMTNRKGAIISLTCLYVMNEMYDKAEEVIKSGKMKRNPFLLYAKYVYYLHEGSLENLDYIYDRIQNIRNKRFLLQKEQLYYLKKLVFEDEYNPSLENSNYKYIKNLCEEYKKNHDIKDVDLNTNFDEE